MVVALAIVSFYTSISGLIKAEMFPPEVRALGVGLSYAVANAMFGGSAEYVALWLKSVGNESMFYWYVTALCAIAGHRVAADARSVERRVFASRALSLEARREAQLGAA